MKKRVLICPLDWGLGHATRCIPVIREFLDEGAEVIIAGDRGPLALLKEEFPGLEFIVFPGVQIKYPRKNTMVLSVLFLLPAFIKNLIREHRLLESIIKKRKIDLVISDNRYGLFTQMVPCVFITHQLNIHAKLAMKVLKFLNVLFIKKYSECWIPDYEGEENLSGKLAHGGAVPSNCFYVGPLSRFKKAATSQTKKYDILVIVSGPEVQRSVFEDMMINQLSDFTGKSLIIRGLPGGAEEKKNIGDIEFLNHAPDTRIQNLIESSGTVICRSGYSSIMDLAALGKSAILVPTPGQTEQEYLAKYLFEKGWFYSVEQNKFNLEETLKRAGSFSLASQPFPAGNLNIRVKTILKKALG